MKLKSFLVLISLFCVSFICAQNSLKIAEVKAGPGEKSKISIDLGNTGEVVGFQFTLTVPDGLVIKEKEVILTDRKGDHVVYPRKISSKQYLFICFSVTNEAFKGNSGSLIEIPAEIPLSYQSGQTYDLKLSGVILSSKEGTDIGSGHQDGVLTIIDALTPDLKVSGITINNSEISPGGVLSVSWGVENIGEQSATGGWTEQISLVSQKTGEKYLLGSTSYSNDLEKNRTVSRSGTFNVPKILGIDGNVKVEVNVVPNPSVKELESAKDNNKGVSSNMVLLQKLLYLTLDKKEIEENSTEVIRATLTQSGDRSANQVFPIGASLAGQLDFPTSVTISKNQSSVVFYIKPIDNTLVDGNRKVKVSVTGNDYPEASEEITIIDDEVSTVVLTPSKAKATDGEQITVSLQTDMAKDKDVKFTLTADQPSRWGVPSEVILPAGSRNVSFTVNILNTQTAEPAVTGKIMARAEGYKAGNAEVQLVSAYIPTFEFIVSPSTISEGDGMHASYGTIKRLDKSNVAVTLKLSANTKDALILPETIEFPANVNQQKFNIGVVDNSIVDNTRTVKITSSLYFSSCKCTAGAGVDGAELSQNIIILDNDGLALSIKANPGTVKAGKDNAAKIIISRNTTDLSGPVTVRLSSDAPTIVTIPETAVIPVGSESVEVSINTKIDSSKEGDQTIRIQAQADGYTNGFGWILVTDQNKPDAVVTKVTTASQVAGGGRLEITTTIGNEGFTTLAKGMKVEYYLSKDKLVKNGTLFATTESDVDIAAGGSSELVKNVQLPDLAGAYYLLVVVNSDNKTQELTYTNNQGDTSITLLPGYTATASVNKSLYKSEEAVAISGAAKMLDNTPAANKDVEITIYNGDFVRSYTVKANSTGNYTYEFQPLPGEGGHYKVSAGYPGTKTDTQAEFDIAGFEWTNKKDVIWEVDDNTPLQGEFKLKNNTKVPLTQVTLVLPDNIDFTIDFQPVNIAAGQEGTVSYSILSNKPTEGRDYLRIPVKIVSNEGAKLDFTAWYFCHTQVARLTAKPVSINTTMTKGASRYYEIDVVNTGSVAAKDVKVELPKLDWMNLASPQVIETIAPYDTIKVIVQLKPTERQQLNVPLSGAIAINPSNGSGLQIPFKIETVSESTGSLQIDVVDEYTYNTERAPHLKGAKVIVRHPFSGKIMAEGLTDENGLFRADDLPEGYYTLTVSADKHSNYQNNILVDPGTLNKEQVFLSYQAISYQWNVVPTEIEDEYRTELVVKFETNVPKPVLTIDIDDPLLDLEPGQSRISYAVITNHGLIALSKVDISVGNVGDYTLTPMITYLDVLNAKSSVTIPVLIKRESGGSKRTMAEVCQTYLIARGIFPCAGEQEVEAFRPYHITVCIQVGDPGPPMPIHPPSNPAHPGGLSGWGGISSWAGSGEFSLELPTICTNPCLTSVLGMVIGCRGGWQGALVSCVLGLVTAGPDLVNLGFAAAGCIPGRRGCIAGMVSVLKSCIYDPLASGRMMGGVVSRNVFWETMYGDFVAMDEGTKALQGRTEEYIGNSRIMNSDYFQDFMREVGASLDGKRKFTSSDILSIKANLSHTTISAADIENFCNRWNKTLEAWNKNILTPDGEYPNIVNRVNIENYDRIRQDLVDRVRSRNFTSASEMYDKDMADMKAYAEQARLWVGVSSRRTAATEKAQDADMPASVCATVTVKFSQKITMTREAFEGTLTLNNGGDAGEVKDIDLDLLITDENGEDATHLFQINKDDFLSGLGVVGPQNSKDGKVIFIPTKQAAPTVAKNYSFGGTLSYLDPNTSEKITVKLYPVTLEVNPSPDLVLHYFMQRDILGDDPLTEDIVEPMVPAEMALLIKNEGYGTAKNVRVESAQPEIIENEKGLLIDFNIIGSNFNNEPKQLGLLNVNFGNIESQKSAIGQWWFTSTLLGHFVKYDINVTHLSSYGNKNLSLIKDYQVHELIKSVKAYGAGQDDISDFLVNDIPDSDDTPDMIYYSNGDKDDVYSARGASVSAVVSASRLTTTLTLTPYMRGWNYGNVEDPGKNKYELTKVVRNSDNFEIPSENFWQTFVTLREGKTPKYENKLHFVDKVSDTETYTLYYTPVNTDFPKVVSFDLAGGVTTEPVEDIQVKFNKPIDVNTFTTQNIKLIHQGVNVPTDDILIGKIDDTTYSLHVKSLTTTSGYYELTVQCAGIKDLEGNEGTYGKSVNWTQVISELGILNFKTDQTQTQPVGSVEIIFNRKVSPDQFVKERLALNGNPVPNVTLETSDHLHYTILGLGEYNQQDETYELSVDLPAMKAEDNTQGLVIQTHKWKVDIILPEVKHFTPQYQGAVNSQNVTDMKVTLNKPVTAFEAGWVTLYKGSVNQNAGLTVTKQDDLHYLISGLGEYTQTAGGYKLSVTQSNFTDESGNYGVGKVDTMWVVSFERPLAPVNMKITPDRGSSSTDNITSGTDLKISLKTVSDKQTIALYAVTPLGETLVKRQYVENAGEILIPVNGYTGKIIFKALAYDSYGNEGDPASIEAYIDNVDLGATISPVFKGDYDCSELDYVQVTFTDEIKASEFTKEAVIVRAGGVSVSVTDLQITRVSDKEFKISQIRNITNNGSISLGVDLSALHKKLSGLQGNRVAEQNIGSVTSFLMVIAGDENIPANNRTATYVATSGMEDYKWGVTGGEIIEKQGNTAVVRWTEKGEQIIILTYITPNQCTNTTSKTVKVEDTMSTEEVVSLPKDKMLVIAPVPNDGRFTLLMKGEEGVFTLNVYDMSGRIVYTEKEVYISGNFRKDINTHIKDSGVYYLILHNTKATYKGKFIVKSNL